jgi:hypothetical protein
LATWLQDRRRSLLVAAPVVSGNDANNTVTITCATAAATIRYTTNNTRPTVASALYAAPFVLADGTFTVRAVAFSAAGMQSVETKETVIFTPPPLPTITLTSMPIDGSNYEGDNLWHYWGRLLWTYNLNGYANAGIVVEFSIAFGPWTSLSTAATVTAGTLDWATGNMGGPFLPGTGVRWRAKHPSGNWSNTLNGQLGAPE